ncbi:MAG: 1-acyl-sn-glycerol-3-phosphate acyltransferase [Microbacter sp.]
MNVSLSPFDDIAPLTEQDVPQAISQLLSEPKFIRILAFLFPGEQLTLMTSLFRSIKNVSEFQSKIAYPFLTDLELKTTHGIRLEGSEHLSKTKNYLFLSNHRDITLDASFLCIKLLDAGFDTVEVAVGDNLLVEKWIETFVRLNKSFIVKRGLRGKEQLEASRHLSAYIHYAILQKHQSVWMAQREGRAKDSNDRTQESLLKMIAMTGDKTPIENLASIPICPLTISYEYDPCDFLKAKEMQQRRDDPCFSKSASDDLISMKTGIHGFKGNIVYVIGNELKIDLAALQHLPRATQFETLAKQIDHIIHSNYHIYPVNHIAFDILFPDQAEGGYSETEKQQFQEYVHHQIEKIDLPGKDVSFLKQKMLEIYANPLVNYREATHDEK